MRHNDFHEDGMGFSGLAPTQAERHEERDRKNAWNRAIEAAAKEAEQHGLDLINDLKEYPATTAAACANRIRSLKR